MFLDVIIDGKFAYSVEGDSGKVNRTTLVVEEGKFLFWGDYKEVASRVKDRESLNKLLGIPSNMIVIPLYKKLCALDCMFVMEMDDTPFSLDFYTKLSEIFFNEDIDIMEDFIEYWKFLVFNT